jgi:hypothetical protein
MKTTITIIAAVLSLQTSVLFAGNFETRSIENDATVFCPTCFLAPLTPAEATFEETTLNDVFTFDFSNLAPTTPAEADFSDIVPEKNIDLSILAPVTPAEADFTDSIEDTSFDLTTLAPVTPAEADFDTTL